LVTIQCGHKTFPGIQAVLFDKDGTLEDSQDFLRRLGIARSRLIDAQIPGTGEPLLMAFGITDNTLDPTGLMAVGSRWENEIAASAYIAETGRSWYEARNIAQSTFQEADNSLTNEFSPLCPGSLTVLQNLAQSGVKIGILSADSPDNLQAFVTRHQLSEYIHLTLGVTETLQKPDPRLFHQACEQLGVEPSATIIVGDSQGDIQMATLAGAAGTIGVAAHLQSADVLITQLDEIKVSNPSNTCDENPLYVR
jgi:phosphoglycolate phosphatase